MHSIRTKITFMTACMVIATMVVATVYGVGAIRDIGNNSARETLRLLCETGEKNLDNYFGSIEQSVEMVAAYVESDLNAIDDAHLQTHLDHVSSIFERLMSKTDGVLTYYYRIDPEVSPNTKGFWYVRGDDGAFHEHVVTDISRYDTRDTSRLVWFTVPKNTGKPVWLPPYITENLGARVLSYNLPIYYNGTFVGVIGIEIDYSTMAEQVNNITLYENGYAFINDSEGNVIYHPHMDVTAMTEQPKVPAGLISESEFVEYAYDGVEKLGVWRPLENGMRLNVSVPVKEVNAGWQSWGNNVVLTFLVMLALFIALTMAFSERLTKPLRDLTAVAKRVDGGDFDCSLDYKGKDEVGVLARTFNSLIAHLKSYIGDLNDLAFADALTSLRNKGAFNYYVESLQTQVNESKADAADAAGPVDAADTASTTATLPAFAVCIFDCNNMKEVNDRYGHDKGDIHLQETARVICETFTHSPVFRIGGDEFAAILQDGDYESRDALMALFDAKCLNLRDTAEESWRKIDIARGMAVYDPEEDESVNDVVRRADRLMYENKWLTEGKL